jgi:hypothetical protein
MLRADPRNFVNPRCFPSAKRARKLIVAIVADEPDRRTITLSAPTSSEYRGARHDQHLTPPLIPVDYRKQTVEVNLTKIPAIAERSYSASPLYPTTPDQC